jgi:hypothetical protein
MGNILVLIVIDILKIKNSEKLCLLSRIPLSLFFSTIPRKNFKRREDLNLDLNLDLPSSPFMVAVLDVFSAVSVSSGLL